MNEHYIKIEDGKTELFKTDDPLFEQPMLVAEWDRVLTDKELLEIEADEYMTFMLNPL